MKRVSVQLFAIAILVSISWAEEKLAPVRHSNLYTLEVLTIQTSHEGSRLITGDLKDENGEFMQPHENPEKCAELQQQLQNNILGLANRKDTTIIRFPLLYLQLGKEEHVEQWEEFPVGTAKEKQLRTINPDNKRPGTMIVAKVTTPTDKDQEKLLLSMKSEYRKFKGWWKDENTKMPLLAETTQNTKIVTELDKWIIISSSSDIITTTNSKGKSQTSKEATITVLRINKPLK